MVHRALRFGAAATAYERYRLGYPEALVDAVLGYAGRPVRTALEIGAGTGKATRAFVARGIDVTATDPDAAMLEQLRAQVPGARALRSSLEELPPGAFDLVFAAASLHWTRAEGRWDRIAALLDEGGVFASFGGPFRLPPDLEEAVRTARSPELPEDDVPSPDGTDPGAAMQWPGTELARAARFTNVRQSTFARRPVVAAEDYLGHLATVSAYLELPDDVRGRVLDRVGAVLPDRVPVIADLTLHLARRR